MTFQWQETLLAPRFVLYILFLDLKEPGLLGQFAPGQRRESCKRSLGHFVVPATKEGIEKPVRARHKHTETSI